MNFYDQYPMMRPYVGKNFHDANTPSLLLIGESHYFPEHSSQHLSAETWYASSSDTLSPDEIEWISTAALLENSRAEDFSNKAHRSIWSNPLVRTEFLVLLGAPPAPVGPVTPALSVKKTD
jgi:hypothetical protein